MGVMEQAERAALLIGVISGDPLLLDDCRTGLQEFGSIALVSPLWVFDFTRYYEKSMGRSLFRRFFLFQPEFARDQLAACKVRTNILEGEMGRQSSLPVERPINLDPGYITLSKLVLASTKDHSHRVYLGRDIYGEVTLFFQNESYRSWPWTYPDYASHDYIAFFNHARQKLLAR